MVFLERRNFTIEVRHPRDSLALDAGQQVARAGFQHGLRAIRLACCGVGEQPRCWDG